MQFFSPVLTQHKQIAKYRVYFSGFGFPDLNIYIKLVMKRQLWSSRKSSCSLELTFWDCNRICSTPKIKFYRSHTTAEFHENSVFCTMFTPRRKWRKKFWTILSNLKKQGKPESWTEKTRICFKNKIFLFYNQNPPNRLIVINKVYLNNIDLPCPLRLYLYTGRNETRHSCSKLYCSKLGTISRQFLRVDCNLF